MNFGRNVGRRRKIQVGINTTLNFPTWRWYLPQKAFQGIRLIQVGIKTT